MNSQSIRIITVIFTYTILKFTRTSLVLTSELKKRVTFLLRRQWVTNIIFKRLITLDISYKMSCPVQRYCSEISLPDLIIISWEVWADTCVLSTGVIVIKKHAVSVYNLETVKEEKL